MTDHRIQRRRIRRHSVRHGTPGLTESDLPPSMAALDVAAAALRERVQRILETGENAQVSLTLHIVDHRIQKREIHETEFRRI